MNLNATQLHHLKDISQSKLDKSPLPDWIAFFALGELRLPRRQGVVRDRDAVGKCHLGQLLSTLFSRGLSVVRRELSSERGANCDPRIAAP